LQQAQENVQPISLSADRWSVLVASAGNEAVVARHARDLQSLANAAHSADFVALDAAAGKSAFSHIADFPRAARNSIEAATVLRISALPTKMPALVEQLTATALRAQIQSAIVVRPYGLIYFALVPNRVEVRTITQIASAVDNAFRVCAENSARAFIELAPTEIKRRVNPWGPEREDLVLMRRVKHVFDPENVLSPGRFAGGI
jgi:glycolate oxidase FAD binding subunit